jgi:hypothetical protein
VALKGKGMDNYFPPSSSLFVDSGSSSSPSVKTTEKLCSTNFHPGANNWIRHLEEHLDHMKQSVSIINNLSNNEYDELLSENIVFINLVDASAVNTLIECIVRDTPILVNRHPAVVELLGDSYPLYYNSYYDKNDSNIDIYPLLTLQKIKAAHKYLANLDKTKYKIEYFTKSLENILAHYL